MTSDQLSPGLSPARVRKAFHRGSPQSLLRTHAYRGHSVADRCHSAAPWN